MTIRSMNSNESSILGGCIVYRYDPKPDTIYLNITNRCTNRCSFCFKNHSDSLSGYRLRLDKEPTVDEVWKGLQDEVKESDKEVVWCGFGEPTIRLDAVLKVTRRTRSKYPSLKVRLNTNGLGQLINKERNVAAELKEAGINSVSISLNAENAEKYDVICSPSLAGAYQAVLDFARDCKMHLSEVILTVVEVEGADISKCERIAKKLGCEFKVR
jgi:cyclic pyranopterin phosphate synthase